MSSATPWATEAFARVLDPFTVADFDRSIREQVVQHVERGEPDRFLDLLDVDDIEEILWARPSTQKVRLAGAGHEISERDYRGSSGNLDAVEVLRHYAAGATIVSSGMHQHHPALADLCTGLSVALHAPVQANVYLTPKREQGFRLHYDTHDVIVVQVEGAKRWQLHDTPLPLPLRGQGFDSREQELGPATREVELRAGDSLYVPRGVPHAAVNERDERSLHVTLGILTQTRAEILIEALSAAALDDPELRTGAHEMVASAVNGDVEALRVQLSAAMTYALEHVDLDRVATALTDSILRESRRLMPGTISSLDRIADLGDDDVLVRPQVGTPYMVTVSGERVELRRPGHQIDVPLVGHPALRHVANRDQIRVGDLPDLDRAARIALADRLVREGFLVFADASRTPIRRFQLVPDTN